MKTSNCCDAPVHPDFMICADCKEPCDIVEDTSEWEKDLQEIFIGYHDVPESEVKQFIRDTVQAERDRIVGEVTPPPGWKHCLKVAFNQEEYCATCGFNPNKLIKIIQNK